MKPFSLWIDCGFPEIWPPDELVIFAKQEHKEVGVELAFLPYGCLEVSIYKLYEHEPFAVAQSPVISFIGEGTARALVRIHFESNQVKFEEIGKTVCDADVPLVIERSEDKLHKTPPTTSIDSVGQNKALQKREDRCAKFQKEPDYQKKIDRRWHDLHATSELLKGDLSLLKAGDVNRIRPVSNYLRILIGQGRGNHILQDCAGFEDRPLSVWVKPPIDPASFNIRQVEGLAQFIELPMILSSAGGSLSHEIDLDTWLEEPSYTVMGQGLTQNGLLSSIANKIGAHADFSDREVSESLQKGRYGGVSLLQNYLEEISGVVLSLVDELLHEKFK